MGSLSTFIPHSGNRGRPLFIEPGRPWEQGYSESCTRKLRDREIVYALEEAQILIEQWRQHHNGARLPSALGYQARAPETMAWLGAYSWPGNARELENAIERVVAASIHPILRPDAFPLHIASYRATTEAGVSGPIELVPLDAVSRRHIARVLAATGGNKKRAAENLGVDRRSSYRMLERYGMPTPGLPPEDRARQAFPHPLFRHISA